MATRSGGVAFASAILGSAFAFSSSVAMGRLSRITAQAKAVAPLLSIAFTFARLASNTFTSWLSPSLTAETSGSPEPIGAAARILIESAANAIQEIRVAPFRARSFMATSVGLLHLEWRRVDNAQ